MQLKTGRSERGEYLMEKLTEKEKACLLEYAKDLKQIMEQDHLAIVSDNRYSYTQKDIENLLQKIEKIND